MLITLNYTTPFHSSPPTYRIFPSLVGPPEEREPLLQEGVDFAQRQPLRRRVLDGHHDERDVRIRRFLLPPDPGLLVRARGLRVQVRRRALRGHMLLLPRLVGQDHAGVVLVQVEVVQMLLDVDSLVDRRRDLAAGSAHFRQLLLIHHTLNIYALS